MKKKIIILKLLLIVNPIIVIWSVFVFDLDYPPIKHLIAFSVMMISSLGFYLLDDLKKEIERL